MDDLSPCAGLILYTSAAKVGGSKGGEEGNIIVVYSRRY